MNIVRVVSTFLCVFTLSACARGSVSDVSPLSNSTPGGRVLLVPELRGGWAGWCLATGYQTRTEGSGGCGGLAMTAVGPILAEESCDESETAIHLYALTTSEVAAVSVYGGMPIPTTTNVTLPDGLRVASVEVIRHGGQPSIGGHCPVMTPLGTDRKPIVDAGKWAVRLKFSHRLPGTKRWTRGVPGEHPQWNARRPADGVCKLTTSRLPRETSARWGSVATMIRPEKGLVGQAFLSCVDVTYFYLGEHALDAAVLLDAAHPGVTPPPFLGMMPLAGHPGVFESPGSGGERVARRIHGAWLVVQEEDNIGLSVPVELLEDLRATVHL